MGQYKYVLDQMDPRNAPRMAYWLSSLLQSDLIENYVQGQIERKYEILYLASSGVDDSKRIMEDMKIKDPSKSIILSDRINVQKVQDINQEIWLVSVFYLNVDVLGGVPDFCVDKKELTTWCKQASKLVDGNLRQITLSYDSTKEPAKNFYPELFRLWRMDQNNVHLPSRPRCTPPFNSVEISPIIPSNISLE